MERNGKIGIFQFWDCTFQIFWHAHQAIHARLRIAALVAVGTSLPIDVGTAGATAAAERKQEGETIKERRRTKLKSTHAVHVQSPFLNRPGGPTFRAALQREHMRAHQLDREQRSSGLFYLLVCPDIRLCFLLAVSFRSDCSCLDERS